MTFGMWCLSFGGYLRVLLFFSSSFGVVVGGGGFDGAVSVLCSADGGVVWLGCVVGS